METLTHILNGFSVCLQPINLWYTFLGVFMGTIIGVLPGIGPSAGIALLLPDVDAGRVLVIGLGVFGVLFGIGGYLMFSKLLEVNLPRGILPF